MLILVYLLSLGGYTAIDNWNRDWGQSLKMGSSVDGGICFKLTEEVHGLGASR